MTKFNQVEDRYHLKNWEAPLIKRLTVSLFTILKKEIEESQVKKRAEIITRVITGPWTHYELIRDMFNTKLSYKHSLKR